MHTSASSELTTCIRYTQNGNCMIVMTSTSRSVVAHSSSGIWNLVATEQYSTSSVKTCEMIIAVLYGSVFCNQRTTFQAQKQENI